MDFVTLKTRVADEAGIDLTQDTSRVGTWINGVYQHVAGVFNWPWLFKASTLQTVADITTGTVSISAASNALTFSSAPTISVANDYMIQFPSTSDDWYFISSHTASSTSASLSVVFTGTSGISGASYICRKVYYSLPSDCDRIIDFRQTITDSKLECVDPRTFDRIIPDPTSTGTPLYYSLLGLDSNNYWRIGLYPIPSAVINLQLRYYRIPTALDASTDTPLIPLKWQEVLIFGALAFYGHPYIDDTRVKSASDRYSNILKDMMEHYNHVPDQRIVLQPWDSRAGQYVLRPRYPSNYPEFYGGY